MGKNDGCDIGGDIFDVWIGDSYFLGSVLLLFAGFAIGYVQLVTNMLVIQFLDNVESIRYYAKNIYEKLDQKQ